MDRRNFIRGLAAGGVVLGMPPLLSACGSTGAGGGADADTLRIIQTQSLTSLDPIWTTSPGTRDLGWLVYDQLVAIDSAYRPQPEMASWTVADDALTYVFTLRDGLSFHDGAPVRPQDCIASIRRWAARDGFGGIALKQVAAMEPVDGRSFRIRLARPFPLLLNALGKSSAPSCLIMPERLANTDPAKQVTEAIGSGPYRFEQAEWVAGSKAAFTRFDAYVPRSEPTDGLAGGRRAGVKRLEFTQIGDASTAMAALQAGEQDYWDLPPADLIPALAGDPNITVDSRFTLPTSVMLQLNHLQPPFDNVAVRRALAMAIDQRQMLRAAVDDPTLIRPCYGYYACATPFASEAGADILKTQSVPAAKAALAAAGYRGAKVVLLGPSDGPNAAISPVVEALMRSIGLNVELVPLDFASITQRRTNKGPVDKGGWSAFLTAWLGTDILDPAVHPMLRGAGAAGYAGWATDPEIERLRTEWALATTPADQMRIAHALQVQAFKTLPYIPLGALPTRSAFRKTVTNVFKAPAAAYYNLGKSA